MFEELTATVTARDGSTRTIAASKHVHANLWECTKKRDGEIVWEGALETDGILATVRDWTEEA